MIGILIALIIGFVLGVFFGDKFLVQVLRIRDWVKSKLDWIKSKFKFNILFLIVLALLLPLSYGGCITMQGTRMNFFSTEINYSGSPNDEESKVILRSKNWFSTKEVIPVDVEKERIKMIESIGGGGKK